MDYIYNAAERHALGTVIQDGPYRLNHISDADATGWSAYTYLVDPLTPLTSSSEDGSVEVHRIRIMAVLSEPEVQLYEDQLPSLDFDLNPSLDSFLKGNPCPRIVNDLGRDFLIACVGKMHDLPIYAVTKITFKRKHDILAGLLTLREALRFSPFPVFLTQEFYSYSLRKHTDFGHMFLPAKGLRYSRLTKSQRRKKNIQIQRKMARWQFR
jgi:hypothetical protein